MREDTKGRILLTGLRQVEVNNVHDLLGVLNHGSSIRQTDATAINAKSSRSHAVFSLNLVQRKVKNPDGTDKISKRLSMPVDMGPEGFMTVDSKMHFVDLAGSERLKVCTSEARRVKQWRLNVHTEHPSARRTCKGGHIHQCRPCQPGQGYFSAFFSQLWLPRILSRLETHPTASRLAGRERHYLYDRLCDTCRVPS